MDLLLKMTTKKQNWVAEILTISPHDYSGFQHYWMVSDYFHDPVIVRVFRGADCKGPVHFIEIPDCNINKQEITEELKTWAPFVGAVFMGPITRPKLKYQMQSENGRRIDVTATSLTEAYEVAGSRLDVRAVKNGEEPPMAWGLKVVGKSVKNRSA